MKTQMVYTVIIGDLIGSSEIVDRPAVSRNIAEAINESTKEYGQFFHGPLVTTQGMDEISGVLIHPGFSYEVCRRLNYAIFPNYFRFAIVRNFLDVNVESMDAAKMDGPAFHIAAERMKMLKNENLFYAFNLNADQPYIDGLLSNLANLVTLITRRRTERQDMILREYMKHGRQKDVAAHLAISQQAVSDSLKGFHWNYIKIVELQIDEVLKNLL